MKKILVFMLLLTTLCGVGLNEAQGQKSKMKMVEKSSKRVPVWMNSSEKEYIIVSAFSNSLESAKAKCMDNVRKSIISSVAQNVTHSSTSSIDQKMLDGGFVGSFEDHYSSMYKTKAAEVPFLKGISDSKIEDYYWEVQEDKKTKRKDYLYAIKYPIPSLELKRLVHEFEKRDQEMYGIYTRLKTRVNEVESMGEIDYALVELSTLTNYFFDDVRLSETDGLRKRYRALYGQITFRPLSQKLGEYKFMLMIGDRPIAISQRISLKSEDTQQLNSYIEGDTVVVTYSYEGSEYDVDNLIRATIIAGGKLLHHDIYYKVSGDPVAIWVEKNVYLKAEEVSAEALSNIEVRLELNSRSGQPYVVKSLFLEIPNVVAPMIINNMQVRFERGEVTLIAQYEGVVERHQSLVARLHNPLVSGVVEVELSPSKELKKLRFTLPYSSNW